MKTILVLVLLACIGIVFYFSWLPNPNLGTETYLPSWLLDWSNYYYNLRTAVPFVIIGFLLEMRSGKKSIKSKNTSRLIFFIQNIGVSAVVVCIAEGGQFLIHDRSPDFMDVFFGILGSGIGALVYYILHLLINFKSIHNEE
jgi:glycopeptide antibiotics resistance protein